MTRTDFLLELIRTRNAAAIASLVAIVIVVRILGNRRSVDRGPARSSRRDARLCPQRSQHLNAADYCGTEAHLPYRANRTRYP